MAALQQILEHAVAIRMCITVPALNIDPLFLMFLVLFGAFVGAAGTGSIFRVVQQFVLLR